MVNDLKRPFRLALLNMYEGISNQGIRAIKEILGDFANEIEYQEFDVRGKCELPDLSFDLYISSGGPGNPLEGDGKWDVAWYNWVDSVWKHNASEAPHKKHVFFICHSFQMVCNHFGLGDVNLRSVPSFGIYPCHKTKAGADDPMLAGLDDPYYIVDSRDWQLVQPKLSVFKKRGASILSLEKIRTHVQMERAIMAVRFSPYMVGTQYHPEADPKGMYVHFEKEENREVVIKNHSVRKYNAMMKSLEHPEHIARTHHMVIPSFLRTAMKHMRMEYA